MKLQLAFRMKLLEPVTELALKHLGQRGHREEKSFGGAHPALPIQGHAAAAPNRASFGCQPENDWTFFGDAYFNRAVRGGANMLPAFDEAKTLIQQWETERNLTPPSNPQRYVGARAAAMLARAERDANQ
jgi:hypothetical protein